MSMPAATVTAFDPASNPAFRPGTGWEDLVEAHGPYLVRLAASYRIGDEARDVVQSAFVRLLERGGTIRDPQAVRFWLATVVRRESLRVLRRAKRERPVDDEADWDVVGSRTGLRSSVDPVAEAAVRADERRSVSAALATLRRRDRELLLLLSEPGPDRYRAASERLGMPIGSIGPTRQRALERMRRALDAAGSGTGELMDCA
jgi:RNA polymerase sigma factor (sigma-70 family)